ncbi:Ribosomal RNA processing protein 1 B [Vanrija pseudolonga]|uniref:Ribosomal RNA processing protein 1 B n=1 Tax=Vanrija pseudolonga TaxID=143232 RepID=A0AAF0YKN6_9TREE|nr:Ribosomal RNA processing protein 1 B [Vanrija pseudolonga]
MSTAARKGKGRAPAPEPKVEAAVPFGKQLAHTDKKVRDAAIANLRAFLSRGGDNGASSTYTRLEDAEMAKLWKGLFYCFWMSDKPLVQQGLASELSNLLLDISPAVKGGKKEKEAAKLEAAIAFLEGFWTSLVREWNGIDRLRMDKYYMLIRRYVNATFRLLARAGWSEAAVSAVNDIMSAKSGPMSWQDRAVPSSLATHLADVYLEELDKVLADEDVEPAPLVAILAPHIALLARTTTPAVHKRLQSVLFDRVLAALKEDEDEDERPAKRAKKEAAATTSEFPHIAERSALAAGADAASPKAVRSALLKALFKEAAQESAVESNRRKIYAVVRENEDDDDE